MPLPAPTTSIPFSDLTSLLPLRDHHAYATQLQALAQQLPYPISRWPAFGEYAEDWLSVEISEFKQQLFYCERGGYTLQASSENLIDLSYQIFRAIIPAMTPSTQQAAATLDRIKDQRQLIWLRMSSEIYRMFQINPQFGMRTAYANVAWMCEELVRAGTFPTPQAAFNNREAILHGLTLSGLPHAYAANVYEQLAPPRPQ